MTRTARYDAKTNTFRELPEMEEPQEPHLRDYAWSDQYHDACAAYSRDFAIYNDHLASLQEIPCHESCKGVFKHDCDYEEGRDYKVYQYEDRLTLAYPVQKDGEDELWRDVILSINDCAKQEFSWGTIIAELKTKYTITPR